VAPIKEDREVVYKEEVDLNKKEVERVIEITKIDHNSKEDNRAVPDKKDKSCRVVEGM
jgi:hypothetical protein